MNRIIDGIVVVIVLLCIIYPIGKNMVVKYRCTEEVKATVLDVADRFNEDGNHTGYDYYLRYEYNGSEYVEEANHGITRKSVHNGYIVTLLVDPDDPSFFRCPQLDDESITGDIIAMLFLSLFIIIPVKAFGDLLIKSKKVQLKKKL